MLNFLSDFAQSFPLVLLRNVLVNTTRDTRIFMAYLSAAIKILMYGMPAKYGIAVLSYDYIHLNFN